MSDSSDYESSRELSTKEKVILHTATAVNLVCGTLQGLVTISLNEYSPSTADGRNRKDESFCGLVDLSKRHFGAMPSDMVQGNEVITRGAFRERKIKVEPELVGSSGIQSPRNEVKEMMQKANYRLSKIKRDTKKIAYKVLRGEMKMISDIRAPTKARNGAQNVVYISDDDVRTYGSQSLGIANGSNKNKPATKSSTGKRDSTFAPWNVFDESGHTFHDTTGLYGIGNNKKVKKE